MTTALGRRAIWHEVEVGGYTADLPLWAQLAGEAAGRVLDLGAGAGRVALRLARAGAEVTALDRSAELLAELRRRAAAERLAVETVEGDARTFSLERSFALVLAPMQLAHLLGGAEGRRAMLDRVAAHLAPGGAFAAALLARPDVPPRGGPPPLPDVREVDGWVYSSQPLEVREVEGGLEMVRLRQLVSPAGELSEEVDAVVLDGLDPTGFEAEAEAAGLVARERLDVAPTVDHVGSTVCVLEARR
jgi:SAM-dependent methyltransferase